MAFVFAKKHAAGIALALLSCLSQAQPSQFDAGQDLGLSSRHGIAAGIASGKPTGVPLNQIVPEVDSRISQEGITSTEALKSAAIARKQACLVNPNGDGSLAGKQECEAINYLQNKEVQRSEIEIACMAQAQGKSPSEISPECKSIVTSVTASSPFASDGPAASDPAVANFNAINWAGMRDRFNVQTGAFSGCTDDELMVSPEKRVTRSCSKWDEVRQESCTWTEPGGSEAQACGALNQHPMCEVRNSESSCVEWARLPGGGEVCKKTSYTKYYACAAGNPQEDGTCGTQSEGCTPAQSTCSETIKGNCITGVMNFSCKIEDAKRMNRRDCSNQKYCIGGNCYKTPAPSALMDSLQAATTMEAARQAGHYFDGSEFQIFKGTHEFCRRKFLKNCCTKTSGGATSNSNIMGQLGFMAASYVGSQAYMKASPYVFDFMYSNSIFPGMALKGMGAYMDKMITSSTFTNIGSLYGLTAWTGTSTVAPGFMHGVNIPGFGPITNTVSQTFQLGSVKFGFDPYSLMFSLALQVLMQMLQCDQSDIITNTHREARLCTSVGEYCSRRLPIIRTCIEWRQSYCCYNSRLARITSEQGRPQIGKSYGSPSAPNCSGFTADEFASLDFSRMNLTEFYSEIMPTDLPAMSGSFGGYSGGKIQEMGR